MVNALVGKPCTCKVPPARLSELITQWNDGAFSTSDLPPEDCQGPGCTSSKNLFE
jgi:hypothetical protein